MNLEQSTHTGEAAPFAAVGDAKGRLFLWKFTSSSRPAALKTSMGVRINTAVAVPTKPSQVLLALANGLVALVDVERDVLLGQLKAHTAAIQAMHWLSFEPMTRHSQHTVSPSMPKVSTAAKSQSTTADDVSCVPLRTSVADIVTDITAADAAEAHVADGVTAGRPEGAASAGPVNGHDCEQEMAAAQPVKLIDGDTTGGQVVRVVTGDVIGGESVMVGTSEIVAGEPVKVMHGDVIGGESVKLIDGDVIGDECVMMVNTDVAAGEPVNVANGDMTGTESANIINGDTTGAEAVGMVNEVVAGGQGRTEHGQGQSMSAHSQLAHPPVNGVAGEVTGGQAGTEDSDQQEGSTRQPAGAVNGVAGVTGVTDSRSSTQESNMYPDVVAKAVNAIPSIIERDDIDSTRASVEQQLRLLLPGHVARTNSNGPTEATGVHLKAASHGTQDVTHSLVAEVAEVAEVATIAEVAEVAEVVAKVSTGTEATGPSSVAADEENVTSLLLTAAVDWRLMTAALDGGIKVWEVDVEGAEGKRADWMLQLVGVEVREPAGRNPGGSRQSLKWMSAVPIPGSCASKSFWLAVGSAGGSILLWQLQPGLERQRPPVRLDHSHSRTIFGLACVACSPDQVLLVSTSMDRSLGVTHLTLISNHPAQTATHLSSTQHTHTDKPYTDKPYTDKPYTDKPYADKPYTDKPFTEKAYQHPSSSLLSWRRPVDEGATVKGKFVWRLLGLAPGAGMAVLLHREAGRLHVALGGAVTTMCVMSCSTGQLKQMSQQLDVVPGVQHTQGAAHAGSENGGLTRVQAGGTSVSGQLLFQGIKAAVLCVAWQPVGQRYVAFGCEDGHVGIMDVKTGRGCTAEVRHMGPVAHVGWAPVAPTTKPSSQTAAAPVQPTQQRTRASASGAQVHSGGATTDNPCNNTSIPHPEDSDSAAPAQQQAAASAGAADSRPPAQKDAAVSGAAAELDAADSPALSQQQAADSAAPAPQHADSHVHGPQEAGSQAHGSTDVSEPTQSRNGSPVDEGAGPVVDLVSDTVSVSSSQSGGRRASKRGGRKHGGKKATDMEGLPDSMVLYSCGSEGRLLQWSVAVEEGGVKLKPQPYDVGAELCKTSGVSTSARWLTFAPHPCNSWIAASCSEGCVVICESSQSNQSHKHLCTWTSPTEHNQLTGLEWMVTDGDHEMCCLAGIAASGSIVLHTCPPTHITHQHTLGALTTHVLPTMPPTSKSVKFPPRYTALSTVPGRPVLAGACSDGSILLWKLSTQPGASQGGCHTGAALQPVMFHYIQAHSAAVYGLSCTPSYVFSVGKDQMLRVLNLSAIDDCCLATAQETCSDATPCEGGQDRSLGSTVWPACKAVQYTETGEQFVPQAAVPEARAISDMGSKMDSNMDSNMGSNMGVNTGSNMESNMDSNMGSNGSVLVGSNGSVDAVVDAVAVNGALGKGGQDHSLKTMPAADNGIQQSTAAADGSAAGQITAVVGTSLASADSRLQDKPSSDHLSAVPTTANSQNVFSSLQMVNAELTSATGDTFTRSTPAELPVTEQHASSTCQSIDGTSQHASELAPATGDTFTTSKSSKVTLSAQQVWSTSHVKSSQRPAAVSKMQPMSRAGSSAGTSAGMKGALDVDGRKDTARYRALQKLPALGSRPCTAGVGRPLSTEEQEAAQRACVSLAAELYPAAGTSTAPRFKPVTNPLSVQSTGAAGDSSGAGAHGGDAEVDNVAAPLSAYPGWFPPPFSNPAPEYEAMQHVLRGDWAAAAATAAEGGVLTAELVNCSLAAGQRVWRHLCQLYAVQQEAEGQPHTAALMLLASGDVAGAANVYRSAGLHQEAAALSNL